EWTQVRIDLLGQIPRQEPQAFARLDCWSGENQALYRITLQRIDGAGYGKPGLASSCRTSAKRNVVGQNILEVIPLARCARPQIASPRAQDDHLVVLLSGLAIGRTFGASA